MGITSQQAKAFIKDMQELLATPEFPGLSRYNQERSWLPPLERKSLL